jgi:TorA maturation chaperone TorD
MTVAVSTSRFIEELEGEDLARARWYSFFARWFLGPPDADCIDFLVAQRRDAAASADVGTELAQAWNAFSASATATRLAALQIAYDDTFISVGEAPVSLHACVYLTGFANERPLSDLRQWLQGEGLQSTRGGLLTEDHFGLLCETMSWLITGGTDDDPARRSVASAPSASSHSSHSSLPSLSSDPPEDRFFREFVAPAAPAFCERLMAADGAGPYRELGRLFAAFIAVERQALEIER